MIARSRVSVAGLVIGFLASFAAAQEPPFVGDWLSDGYGYCARIDAGGLTLFEVTPLSAIEEFRAARAIDTPDDGTSSFHAPGGVGEISLLPADEPDSFALQSLGAASNIVFHRVAQAPDVVGRPVSDDPETTFEIFWQTFADHYPFFALREVDWNAMRARYRPDVTRATKPAELFAVLRAMIEPLHDAHTSLRAPSLAAGFSGSKPLPDALDEKGRARALAIVDDLYVQGKLEVGCNGHVRFGSLDAHTGYLRIDAFSGYSLRPDFTAFLRALDETLDAGMTFFAERDALVIDVRINGGGSDVLGVAVASRLTDREYVAFVKRARNDPERADGWTPPQETLVKPSARPRFLGQVFLLTGPDSVSAAETFTMALLGRRPPVIRVGESTQGVYSDVLGRRLPNGWSFGFPNEVFLTDGGEHFERRGVPPDHEVRVFAPEDLAAGRDACIEKVFEIIDGG